MKLREHPSVKYLTSKKSYGSLFIVILIFLLGCLISLLSWRSNVDSDMKTQTAKFNHSLNESKAIITQSLNQYSLLLDDGASLLSVDNDNVTQAQWLAFFRAYDLPLNYPGVDAVSFAQYVPQSDLANYIAGAAARGVASTTITPPGNRNVYTPVTYIGYVSPASLSAMGFDQLSNPVRAAAITSAIDSGTLSMSGKVNLVAVNKNQSSFLIYEPVYNGPAANLSERQSSIYGLVFIAVSSKNFFNALLGKYLSPDIAVAVYDQKQVQANLLYQSPKYSTTVGRMKSPVYSTLNVAFGNHQWSMRIVSSRTLIDANGTESAADTFLVVGLALSLIAATVVWYFTYYRERKLYWQNQAEVQAAKDELLSLASHQLRTPATVVKQYLGVLLQNYSGEITKEQRKMIQTAYDSNERQLEIANQFLNAARLGSGRIELNRQRVSLNELIDGVLVDQRRLAAKRRLKLVFKKPKRPLWVSGDPKYLPMVFENLINNAIKYSRPRTTIEVTLRRKGDFALVSVKDKGMGIAADDLTQIFDKFSRGKDAESGSGQGTGIGLYLAKQITDLHGGYISVSSELNKGSEFSVELPLKTRESG